MLSRIEQLLRVTIGLDAASVGSTLIERTVRLRMKARGQKTLSEYATLLETTPAELNDLIEAVVVPETWFYRNPEIFGTLARLVREQWLPAHPAGLLRILSVPCSSGEEPYTIAMTLLDAGVPAARFEIRAVDISAHALARARRGLYGKNSFRTKDLGFRQRYFQNTKDGYLIGDAPRARVLFQRGNLLEEKALAQYGIYDFIFCRNLLIYFDRPTQGRAVQRLQKLLAPDGMCFVGAAELPLALHHGFDSANIPMAFACRKRPAPAAARNGTRDRIENQPHTTRLRRATQPLAPRPVPRPAPTAPSPARPARGGNPRSEAGALEQARLLADAGRLGEAAQLCRAHLNEHGQRAGSKGERASLAGTYYLLGLVHDARGEGERAQDCYRKVLYLEPNHYEALMQLALQKEKNGDAAGARVLRQRAIKVSARRAGDNGNGA